MIAAVGWGLLAFALLGVLYTLGAGLSVGWFFSRPQPTADDLPPVTILKPLHGEDAGLQECLAGFCEQDYPAPIQIVFGVRDRADPAIRVVRRLCADHPDLDIELVIDDRLYGTNRKISNLINMERKARHPTLVVADSDVNVGRTYLRQLMAALSQPGVGFATCAFIGVPRGNGWSRLSAMAINHHFLPSVALGLRLKLAKPCFGPTMAFRKAVFDRAGGFRRFADHLADDFEIGRAIRDLGYGFSVPVLTIGHGCPERTARSLVSHELRWARTIRLIDPLSYAGSAVCHPLPFALAAALLLHGSAISLAAAALALASRIFVVARVDAAVGRTLGPLWMSPVRDLLSAAVFLSAYCGSGVEWRGSRFRIGPNGVLVPRGPRRALAGPRPGALDVEGIAPGAHPRG